MFDKRRTLQSCPDSLSHQPSQHSLQNPAVAIILDFDGRIDSTGGEEFFAAGADDHILARPEVVIDVDVENFFTSQSERRAVLALLIDKRENTHADEVAAMDTLEALSNDGFYAEQEDALGRPVSRASHA